MPVYEIEGIGTAIVEKNLECDFSVSADEFFDRYSAEASGLSAGAIEVLRTAIDSGKRQKLKKERDDIDAFLSKIQSGSGGRYGESADEWEEHGEIEELKGREMDATGPSSTGRVSYESGTGTYDETTGKKEGVVEFGSGGNEGKLVPLIVSEHVETHQTHEGEEIEADAKVTGTFTVKNPSETARLWDIDIQLANIDKTDLGETLISIQELDPGAEDVREFSINDDGNRHVVLEEFISTLNDPETPSFALSLGVENTVYFKLTLTNITDATVSDIKLVKTLQPEFSNVQVVGTSAGTASFDSSENQLVWEIEEIEGKPVEEGVEEPEPEPEPEPELDEDGNPVEPEGGSEDEAADEEAIEGVSVTLEFRANLLIEDKDTKVQSGAVTVDYTASTAISGLEIEKFDAYSNNRFYLSEMEMDEKPDYFQCQLVFQNTSDFMVRLVNADVWDPADETHKFVDIDPNEVPELPADATWYSNFWEYYAKDGEPVFKHKCEFFVVADHLVSTIGTLTMDDVELAVASIEGVLEYSVELLSSFREIEFTATHTVTNTGGAFLNEVIVQETIQEMFKPPSPDQISVLINDEEIELSEDAIVIEPADQESSPEHVVKVQLLDLKETSLEAFKPDDVLKVSYPIIADKPQKGVVYTSNVVYMANTDPAGAPIEVTPDTIEIPVEHIRKKLQKGKEIRATGETGEYTITIFMRNIGQFAIPAITVRDKVPDNFEYSDMSEEPEITDLEGEDILEWKFEEVQPGDSKEITYVIRGTGEYRASDAQFSM
ncbi:MAG: hypothetical protein ACTSU5_04465 [Promethearchaeota archaeon]